MAAAATAEAAITAAQAHAHTYTKESLLQIFFFFAMRWKAPCGKRVISNFAASNDLYIYVYKARE